MAYEVVMPYHLHMPSYFLETFTEYPYLKLNSIKENNPMDYSPFLFIRYLIYYK